jgi:hypothetical protein
MSGIGVSPDEKWKRSRHRKLSRMTPSGRRAGDNIRDGVNPSPYTTRCAQHGGSVRESRRPTLDIKKGGDQVEYEDQDRRIHPLWLDEMKQNGLAPRWKTHFPDGGTPETEAAE